MKRTVKALQDLYVKLGGSLTDTYNGIANGIKVGLYKRIPDIIEAVKEKASGGGGGGAGLPEVTAADNGDVLTVVEGAWAKADAPSGGAGLPEVTTADNGDVLTVVEGAWAKAAASGALIIGINVDAQTELQSLNKTWQEIYNAMSSGRGAIIVDETSYTSKLAIEVYADDSTTPPQYLVACLNEGTWMTESADGYPVDAS